jgi:RNA polymerase-binding protein DksA
MKRPQKSGAAARKAPAKSAKTPAAAKSHKATSKAAPSKPVVLKPSPVVKPSPKVVVVKKSSSAKPSPLPAVKPAKSKKTENHQPHSEPVTISAPVPTDGKPRKNQAGLSSKELEHFRELLLAKRRELVGDMSSMEREALRSTTGTNLSNLPLHMADMGTDNYEQEFTLGLVEKDRGLLREINQALAKIQDGSYGLCEGTGKPISKPRLEAQPWARFSIEHARMMERTGMGIRRIGA